MVMSYEEFCESKLGEKALDIIYNTIYDLNVPNNVYNKLVDVIADYAYEILEDKYEDYISEYQDRAYDEYKDSKYEM